MQLKECIVLYVLFCYSMTWHKQLSLPRAILVCWLYPAAGGAPRSSNLCQQVHLWSFRVTAPVASPPSVGQLGNKYIFRNSVWNSSEEPGNGKLRSQVVQASLSIGWLALRCCHCRAMPRTEHSLGSTLGAMPDCPRCPSARNSSFNSPPTRAPASPIRCRPFCFGINSFGFLPYTYNITVEVSWPAGDTAASLPKLHQYWSSASKGGDLLF